MAKTGRPAAVWWWAARKRWTINVAVGSKRQRKVAPASIGPDDFRAAERWAAEILKTYSPDAADSQADPSGSDPSGSDREPERANRLPSRRRVALSGQVRPRTAQRLARLVQARRRATGKPIHRGQVLDELIEAAWRESRAQPPSAGAGAAG